MRTHLWGKISALTLILLSVVQISAAQQSILNLEDAELPTVAPILAKLVGKSVVVSSGASAKHITFRYTGTTSPEALAERLEKSLEEQGVAIAKVDEQTLKVVAANETNNLSIPPHIVIDVQTNSIVVDKKVVLLNELWDAIKSSVTPETEIWIHDANPEPRIRTPGKPFPSTTPPSKVVRLLHESKVRPDKIFQLHLP